MGYGLGRGAHFEVLVALALAEAEGAGIILEGVSVGGLAAWRGVGYVSYADKGDALARVDRAGAEVARLDPHGCECAGESPTGGWRLICRRVAVRWVETYFRRPRFRAPHTQPRRPRLAGWIVCPVAD